MDLCSNQQTFLQAEAASRFESLEPLEGHVLQDSDFIRFGSVVVTFHNPTCVESSQLTEAMNQFCASARSKLFVPATQELDFNPGDSGIHDNLEIPETEQATQAMAPPSPSKNSRGSASSSILDVLTEFDEASNDDKVMFSQNIFGATKKTLQEETSDDDDTFHSLDLPKVVSQVPAQSDRNGSVTPDLVLPEETALLPNNLKKEPESPAAVLQSMIDTDDGDTDEEAEDKFKLNRRVMLDPTQPFFGPRFRTRLQQKRQAEIKPKTVSLADFEDTQDVEGESLPKKACFALETQPLIPAIPKSASVGLKVVNRILMSSDEEDWEDESVKVADEASQSQVGTEPCTPGKQSDRFLDFDQGTPDIFPELPSASQLGRIFEIANASQASVDSSVDAIEEDHPGTSKAQDKENIWQPPRQEVVPMPKKPRRKIMKYDSDDEAGPSSLIKVRKRPKKFCAIAISNGTTSLDELCKTAIETLNGKIVEKIAEADVLLTHDKLKLTAKLLASVCRRIPIVGSDYLEASLRAGAWLDSKLFIIYDRDLEKRKNVSLKATILATVPRVFENFSVLATPNTSFPRNQLVEIIENADGEFLESLDQEPTRDNLAVIFNKNDKAELEAITTKYTDIRQIIDTSFASKVLQQKL